MNISVVGRHVDVPDAFRDFVHEKASKLPRYYDRVQSIDVIVDRESDLFLVEMIVQAAGTQSFVAKEVGAEMRACVDLLMDKMERQLTRHKEKHRNRKHPSKKVDLPE